MRLRHLMSCFSALTNIAFRIDVVRQMSPTSYMNGCQLPYEFVRPQRLLEARVASEVPK